MDPAAHASGVSVGLKHVIGGDSGGPSEQAEHPADDGMSRLVVSGAVATSGVPFGVPCVPFHGLAGAVLHDWRPNQRIGASPFPGPAFARERAAAALISPPEMSDFVQRRGVRNPGLDLYDPDLVAVDKRVTLRRATAPCVDGDPVLVAQVVNVPSHRFDALEEFSERLVLWLDGHRVFVAEAAMSLGDAVDLFPNLILVVTRDDYLQVVIE